MIEGDQQTSLDADRMRATGAPAVQINTGKGCHLDAHMVGHALSSAEPADDSLLLIENVGNLVCPAAFDLGEAHKVVILSVTEGDDKPLKYPDMFHAADLLLINKIDLLPYVDVRRRRGDRIRASRAARSAGAARLARRRARVSPSGSRGSSRASRAARAARDRDIDALRRRVAELEAELVRRRRRARRHDGVGRAAMSAAGPSKARIARPPRRRTCP